MTMRRIASLMLVVVINYAGSVAAQQATTTGSQSPAVIAGGNVTITYSSMSAEEKKAFAQQIAETLVEMKVKGAPEVGPGAEQRVEQAVTGIATGASEGDQQLQQALSLLAAGNAAQATPLLRAVADNKVARIQQDTARIQKDRQEAATAYRNLGAIAGLRDPKAALDAYAKAAELDPDDAESLYWAGNLEVDHGELSSAEARLRRVLSLTAGQDGYQYWAQVGLADIKGKRGDLPGALKSYRDSLAIAERLAKADPGNAEWQRDLSVAYNKVGDVLVEQGDLPGALSSYQASHDIFDRLAKSDPGNAGWQRDLSVSHNEIGDVQVEQGNLPAALSSYQASHDIFDRLAKSDPGNAGWQRDLALSFGRVAMVVAAQGDSPGALLAYRQGREIIVQISKQSPDNARLHNDLVWFDAQIGAKAK
jgi:tetratricopeptide (TPR) repeat protein